MQDHLEVHLLEVPLELAPVLLLQLEHHLLVQVLRDLQEALHPEVLPEHLQVVVLLEALQLVAPHPEVLLLEVHQELRPEVVLHLEAHQEALQVAVRLLEDHLEVAHPREALLQVLQGLVPLPARPHAVCLVAPQEPLVVHPQEVLQEAVLEALLRLDHHLEDLALAVHHPRGIHRHRTLRPNR